VSDGPKLALVHSGSRAAREGYDELVARYDFVPVPDAEVIVALGGDGFMLHTLHEHLGRGVTVFGMNRGTIGFLMNAYGTDGLVERVRTATDERIAPLRARVTTTDGRVEELLAINEVSLIRASVQAANLQISVNDVERLERVICDGLLCATPAGSTAYNLSARGPVVPLGARLMTLTPVSPFRPRRWHGALLPHDARVRIDVLDATKRPVNAGADSREVRDAARVEVVEADDLAIGVLFDPGHSLEERILSEQFA
jgi:NAD+ kinase